MYYLHHPLYRYLSKFRRVYSHYKYEILELNYLGWIYWFAQDFTKFNPSANLEHFIEAPEENPDMFMMMHPEMKKNFQKFGDVCYMTIIEDGIIRKKENFYATIKFWEIIAFTGLTQENRFAPFCFVFLELTQHSAENISKVAEYFFNVMKKTPKVIITPNEPFYEEVREAMHMRGVFRGGHYYDPLCELEKISKAIQTPSEFAYFYKLFESTTPNDYYQNLQLLYNHVAPTLQIRKILSAFQQSAPRMCFALIPTE
jgi:hypothetical protein